MLARLVSDTWLSGPDATIFIDRDGERFKHVLDYMRYRKVSLPITVSREMFLLDMEYYGFTSVDTDNSHRTAALSQIDDSNSKAEVILRCTDIFHADHRALIAKRKSKEELEAKIIRLEKATECAHRFIGKSSGQTKLQIQEPYASGTPFYQYLNDKMHKPDLLNSCLDEYGLKAAWDSHGYLVLIAMMQSKQLLEEEIMCLEKARGYAHLFIGKNSDQTSLTTYALHGTPFFNYLNGKGRNPSLLNSCLVGYGLKAALVLDGSNGGRYSITIETLKKDCR